MIDSKMIQKDFGKLMKYGRERKGLSQRELAELLGISQVHLCHLENGDRTLHFTVAVNICKILNLDLSAIIEEYM